MKDFTTCKLIFPVGTITKEQVSDLLKQYTSDFSVGNFYPEIEVGVNKICFAVVDIPRDIIPRLMKEKIINDVDLMASYTAQFAPKQGCGSGGCGS